jgi:hypothetical protein
MILSDLDPLIVKGTLHGVVVNVGLGHEKGKICFHIP